MLFVGGPRDGWQWSPGKALPAILAREKNDAGFDSGRYEKAWSTSPVGIMVPQLWDNCLIYAWVPDPNPDGPVCEFVHGPLSGSRRILAARPSEWIVPGSEGAGRYSRDATAETPADLVRYTWREALV